VELQLKASGQAIGEDPFRQDSRLEDTVHGDNSTAAARVASAYRSMTPLRSRSRRDPE
jgi:hypothetical protein